MHSDPPKLQFKDPALQYVSIFSTAWILDQELATLDIIVAITIHFQAVGTRLSGAKCQYSDFITTTE